MKNKMLKIIFIVSFIPYILVLLCGILCAIFGVMFIYNEVYGTDAFILGVMALGYMLIFMVPIIPICVIFQVAYFIRRKVGKVKQIEMKKYLIVCCVIALVVVAGILINSFSYTGLNQGKFGVDDNIKFKDLEIK